MRHSTSKPNIHYLTLSIASWIAALWPMFFSVPAAAHAEHDKPRYVSTAGEDNGRCDTIANACKSIGYAAGQASKGDKILVAEGHYDAGDLQTLFYLTSDVVPVRGGHAPDNFAQDPGQHPSHLTGVPAEFADSLAERGFTVIVDSKGFDLKRQRELYSKLGVLDAMKAAQGNTPCTNGQADAFNCRNIDLVAHMPLAELGGTQGNDVWGHYDLNDGREYALMGLSNGTAVVDISTPDTPRLVTHIPGQRTTWRDIKVLQVWSATEARWQAYAYVTADSASVGLQIIDLSELPERARLAATNTTDLSAHNVYLSNVDYSTGVPLNGLTPLLHLAGSNTYGGAFNTYNLDNPAAPTRIYHQAQNTRSNYSHDLASMVIEDGRKDTQCVHGTGSHCEILFDFNENDVRLWDKTRHETPAELSRTTYTNMAYVHSGWWSEDKQFMVVHDELDEQHYNLNTQVYFFDISDLRDPVLISTFNGPTGAIDHNGFVRGNRYYMSNYERGLTILDITDPTQPTEAGFFDTYPVGDIASFNGAWGTYPFLPSGLILVSDINSGLYLLKDQTLATEAGRLQLDAATYYGEEGENLSVRVQRNGGSQGAVSVAYEILYGATDSHDLAEARGRLHWANGESQDKTVMLELAADTLSEPAETLLLRLFDPSGGATLNAPNIAPVTIVGATGGSLRFEPASISLRETDGPLTLMLQRVGPIASEITATLNPSDSAAIQAEPANFHWDAGAGDSRSFTLQPVYNPATTGDQTLTIDLTGTPTTVLSNATLTLSLRDEQSNLAPLLPEESTSPVVAPGAPVTLSPAAEDPEGFALSYQWQQSTGTTVPLANTTSANLQFTAPSTPDTLAFTLTVTDDFGVEVSQAYSVSVVDQSDNTPPPASGGDSGGGGGASVWLLLLTLLATGRRRIKTCISKLHTSK